MNTPLRAQISAALAGLTEGLPSVTVITPDIVQLVLEEMGDALRAGLDVPTSIRILVKALTPEQLAAAAQLATAEIDMWSLPRSTSDHTLPFTLQRRDATASFRVASFWW